MSKTRTWARLIEEVGELDPREAANRLVRAQSEHDAWLDVFAEQLDKQRNADALRRILSVWDLNQSDAARVFGVTRQAIAKWFDAGVPPHRAVVIVDLGAATDLLVRHLKRDRVAAVVRRPAERLANRSLLDLVLANDHRGVLEACRSMFAFGDAHSFG
jgi:hypothetical protein